MTKPIRRGEKKLPEKRNIYFWKVVDKGLRILELFRPEVTSLSMKDIAAATRITRTSAFRFIDTLVQLGYLRKDHLGEASDSQLVALACHAVEMGPGASSTCSSARRWWPATAWCLRTSTPTWSGTTWSCPRCTAY